MKKGRPLTVAEARDAAVNEKLVWCELTDFTGEDREYFGPVAFEPAKVGYYVNAADGSMETTQEAMNEMFADFIADHGIDGFSVCLTDFNPDDYLDESDDVFEEFDEGTFALYVLEDFDHESIQRSA